MSVSIRGLMVPTKLRSGDSGLYCTVATSTGRPGSGVFGDLFVAAGQRDRQNGQRKAR